MKCSIITIVLFLAAATMWAQVPREGFEQWDSLSGAEAPRGWYADPFGCGKVTNVHGGNYAASVWNWYYYAKGFLVTGPERAWYYELDRAGVPISYKPARISGYYRYERGENNGRNDSGVVYVLLKHYNAATGGRDTIGFVKQHLGPAATYTPFTIDIRDYAPGVDPDSIGIAFMSSDSGFCNVESDGKCCYFSIDDIQLSTAAGVAYSAAPLFEQARVYPNPMRSEARVEWDARPGIEYRIRIYSEAGNLLRSVGGLAGGSAKLDRAALPAGSYLYEIRDADNIVASRGRFIAE